MKIHFIIHEEFEAPGAYENWAIERGYSITYSRLYNNEPLPQNINEIDFLLIMGGPQSPDTTQEECFYFNARAEQNLINQCIEAKKVVLGVCLGAQLIGEALNAPHTHSPEVEIGTFPIFLTQEGKKHPHFLHFSDTITVGHWHGDMPGLTNNAKIIAYSTGCPRQIIEYTPRVYGFQCHMEFTHESIKPLIKASKNEFIKYSKHRFIQHEDLLRRYDYSTMNRALFKFMDYLTEYIKHK